MKISEKSNFIPEKIWDNCDLLISAIDKSESKKILIEKSIWNEKNLLDISVNGLQCCKLDVIPFKTSTTDKFQQNFECIISEDKNLYENFPFLPEHNIIWAKQFFDMFFIEFSKNCVNYIKNPSNFIQKFKNLLKNNPEYKIEVFIMLIVLANLILIYYKM